MSNLGPRAWAAVAAVAVLLEGASPAAAEPTAAEIAIAEELFKTGRELLEAGKTSEACPKFAESQRIDPRLGTLLNLAACHALENKTASAWAEFTDAAVRAERAGQRDRASLARGEAAKLERRLSRIVVRVAEVDASGAEILVDGARLGAATVSVPIPLDPGRRAIEVRAPGKRPYATEIVVPNGPASQTVSVPRLESEPAVAGASPGAGPPGAKTPAPAATRVADTAPPRGGAQRFAGATIFTVGLGAVAAGIVFGVRAISIEDDADAVCPGRVCPTQDGFDLHEDAARSGTWSTVFVVAGVAAVAVGASLFLAAPSSSAVQRALRDGAGGIHW